MRSVVKILEFFFHSDFVWNQILVNWNRQKMPFLAILEVMNFDFDEVVQGFKASYLNQNVKSPFFEIQILPKLIPHKKSRRKISCIFTLWYEMKIVLKFLMSKEKFLVFRFYLFCWWFEYIGMCCCCWAKVGWTEWWAEKM